MRQNPTEYGVEASWLTSNEEIQLVFCGKVMLTPFCDSEEPLLEDYMEKGCMIYIQYKIQCFANHQTETSNSPEMPKKGLLFHHNAPRLSHTSVQRF